MPSPALRLLAGAIALCLLGAQQTGSAADRPWPVTVEPVPTPAGDQSSSPQITSSTRGVAVSWLERASPRTVFKFAERTPAGWGPARTIASGNDLIVNAADVPSVRLLDDGTVAAVWMVSNSPDPEAYDLRLAFSRDGGATWSRPVSPHHDRTKTQHGFATLFQAPRAGLGLVWLDGRATSDALPHPSDTMSLRAAAFSRAGRQLRETTVDARVCDCCSTSVAVTADGPLVAYRDRSEQEIRDISVSRLSGGRWSAPVTVHADGWRIEACPVNGPAVAARGRDVAVAWFTAVNNEGRTFVAFSKDAGRTFGPPIRVDEESSTGQVGVELLADGAAAVSWIEFAGGRSQFKVRRVDPAGMRSAPATVAGAGEGRVAGHPRMALAADELLFAWTETGGGASHVRTARAALR